MSRAARCGHSPVATFFCSLSQSTIWPSLWLRYVLVVSHLRCDCGRRLGNQTWLPDISDVSSPPCIWPCAHLIQNATDARTFVTCACGSQYGMYAFGFSGGDGFLRHANHSCLHALWRVALAWLSQLYARNGYDAEQPVTHSPVHSCVVIFPEGDGLLSRAVLLCPPTLLRLNVARLSQLYKPDVDVPE